MRLCLETAPLLNWRGMNSRVFLFFTTLFFLTAASGLVFLWAQGYSLDRTSGKLEKTGMILTKSEPDGAKIIVDEVLTSATNATLANLKPGEHKIRIEKEGFVTWQKTVTVKEQMVTELSAVLIPLTPKLLPLTSGGANHPALSSDGSRIAFFNQKEKTPGIWLLPLSGRSLLNLTQASPKLLLADAAPAAILSSGLQLKWSPDDSEILAQINRQGYYLIDTTQTPTDHFSATASAEGAETRWRENEAKSRKSLLDKSPVSPEILAAALSPQTLWAQNGKRFLYQKETADLIEYRVYDLSDPLPVGGFNDYQTLRVEKNAGLKVSWYSDSSHLLLFSCQKTDNGAECREGTVEIVEINGENRTQIYKGVVFSDRVFPTPDGSQLIILTSFNPEGEPNLYAISLR